MRIVKALRADNNDSFLCNMQFLKPFCNFSGQNKGYTVNSVDSYKISQNTVRSSKYAHTHDSYLESFKWSSNAFSNFSQ